MNHAYRRVLTSSFLLASIALSARSAPGQSPIRPIGGEAPTTGIRLHAPTLVGRVDASALEVNPATLGLLPAWSIVFHHSQLRADGRVQGSGDALFVGVPLPFYRALALGLGVQWLRPSDAVGYADSAKLSLSAAWQPARWAGIGLAFHSFVADKDPALDALESVDAGLVLRPSEWAGFGFAVRNLNTPVYDGLPLERVYDLELTLRPLLTQRLEIGVGFAAGERRGNIDPHLRIVGEPIDGISLLGHVEMLRRDFYRDSDSRNDVRATVGLAVSLEQVSVTASTLVGRSFDRGPGALGTYGGARSAFQGANVSLALSGSRQRSIVSDRKVLQLSLSGDLTQSNWVGVDRTLREVTRRDDIHAVLLRLDELKIGWAQAQELRDWIARLHRHRKKVYVHIETPSATEYCAVAGADRLMLAQGGGIRLQGLATQQLYLRGLFDKLGVKPQFIRIAEYKSAPEALTRRSASEPAKKMMSSLVDDLYRQILADLAADRHKTVDQVRQIVDRGPYTPDRARLAGLVDDVVDPQQLEKIVRQLGGQLIAPDQLVRAPERWPAGPAIAVVLIEGDIVHGKSSNIPLIDRRVVGDETIVQALERARSDSRIKAVILRVDSPGGSALASERIWQAVRHTAERKPVLASLADVAASGGYFAAAGADHILADRASLTGSIGIFTGKFDFSGLLDKLSIGVHTTRRGAHATLESAFQPYTPQERQFILSRLQYYYRGFLRAVGQGRSMTMNQVHAVGQGRVWTGDQARTHKLVDRQGGLADAIDEAQRRAGIAQGRHIELIVLPKPQRNLVQRLVGIVGRTEGPEGHGDLARLVPPQLTAQLRRLPAVMWYADAGEPLARLPYDLTITRADLEIP